jgi:hypothetical protein
MFRLVLAALLVLALPGSGLAGGEETYQPPSPPGTGSVAIYRGSTAAGPSPVPVYRGSAIAPARLPAADPSPAVAAVGGERVWFVDRARGELVGCRLVSTFTVGRNVIRCVRRGLPVD